MALYSIACLMYLLFGYQVMYGGGPSGLIPGLSFGLGAENTVAEVVASEGYIYYSNTSDFFFQVVFVATAMSIVSGAVAERMKLWSFLVFTVVMTGIIYPVQGYWTWGRVVASTPRTVKCALFRAPICLWPRSACSFCGWAGSASMAVPS